jgi:hypothetical protein
MPPATSEKALQGRIVKAIKKEWPGAWCFHPVGGPYQVAGIPDLLVCVQGRLIGIEVKHRKPSESREHALGRVTPQQRHQLNRIIEAGGVAGAVVSVEEAIGLVRSALPPTEEKEK